MQQKAIDLINMVLVHEGGYCNIKGDSGKMTYRGISRKYFPNWEGWKIIDENMPLKYNQILNDEILEENVIEFYYDNFYKPLNIEYIDSLIISAHLICHGVNAGIKNSVKQLQKSICKVYNTNISIDGIIGNTTIKYANNIEHLSELENELANTRKEYYKKIVNNNPSQKKFLKGWLNRVDNTTKFAGGKCNTSVYFTSLGINDNIITKILKFIIQLIKYFIKNK